MSDVLNKLQLEQYGINDVADVVYNPTYEQLYEEEMSPSLEGFEVGVESEFGAVKVDTGIFTGRSPKDKYVVMDETTKDTVWWKSETAKSSDNKPISKEIWKHGYDLASKQLSGKRLFVMDLFCGANEDTRLKVRFVMEVAWQAHFVKNMFIRPSDEQLVGFEPDFVVLNAAKTTNPKWEEQGLNSDVFAFFNLTEKRAVIGGTWYGGEMKKGIFSVMNYYLPLQGIASMHCSANMSDDGDVAIFFGLSSQPTSQPYRSGYGTEQISEQEGNYKHRHEDNVKKKVIPDNAPG